MAGLDCRVLTRAHRGASRISGARTWQSCCGTRLAALRLAAQLGDTFPPGLEFRSGKHLGARGEAASRSTSGGVDDPRNFIRDSIAPRNRRVHRAADQGRRRGSWGPGIKTIVPRRLRADEMGVLTSFAHRPLSRSRTRGCTLRWRPGQAARYPAGLNRLISSRSMWTIPQANRPCRSGAHERAWSPWGAPTGGGS